MFLVSAVPPQTIPGAIQPPIYHQAVSYIECHECSPHFLLNVV